jgi:TRAP-type C4-dicarboxylate transport system permease small subunit
MKKPCPTWGRKSRSKGTTELIARGFHAETVKAISMSYGLLSEESMGDSKDRIRIDHWIVAVLLAVMATIAFVNVISRYLVNLSFAATEEITVNLFVWLTVVGSGIAFERGGQLGMVTLYNVLPHKLKKFAILLSSSLSAILFVIVDLYVIQAIHDEITLFWAISPALGIPVWIYYLGVPVLSVFVFTGIYKDASSKLKKLEGSRRT